MLRARRKAAWGAAGGEEIMPCNILMCADGLPGLAEPARPETLRALSPSWAADVAALGPLEEIENPVALGRCLVPVDRPDDGAPRVVVTGRCGSTMDVARRLVEAGALRPWDAVLAPEQTAGRGQLRRAWVSRPGNLHVTLVCPEATGLWNDLRPLVFGWLFAGALQALGPAVRVKWPNDLLCDDRKIAGMLVEERPGCVLTGIGVNLAYAPEPEEMRADFKVAAGKFSPRDPNIGPLGLWRTLVNQIETSYASLFDVHSPNEFLTMFRSRMAWAGRRVLVREGVNVLYEAIVEGVSAEGALVLNRTGQSIELLAGDVIPV